jgi:hypothetical protein
MVLFDGFPSATVLYSMEGAALLAGLCLLAGLGRAYTPIGLGILLIFYQGFLYSTGKIDHGSHLLVTSLIILAFSPWSGDTVAGENDPEGTNWPLTFLALMVGFAMFTAGAQKLLGGWLWVSDQAVQNVTYRHVQIYGRESKFAETMLATLPWTVWEALDWSTVLFEIGFFFAVFSPRWFRMFCAGAVFFHLGVLLVLSIPFTNQLPVYAAFLDWDRIAAHSTVRRLSERLSALWKSASLVGRTKLVGAGLGALVALKLFVVQVLNSIEVGGLSLTSVVVFAAGMIAVAAGIYRSLDRSRRS